LKRECTFNLNIKAYYNPKLGPKTDIADRQETKQVKACEGIMCEERVDGYKFMCSFLIRNTPGHDSDKVHVFSGDGSFDQAMVHDLGFQNARYLKDWFHLFFTGLTDTFGQYGAELLEDELKQMIRARNQEYFIQAKMNATTKLHQISPHNMLLEKKLEEFANANHEYSQFQIDTMKGS
jgi:hypothetical protein